MTNLLNSSVLVHRADIQNGLRALEQQVCGFHNSTLPDDSYIHGQLAILAAVATLFGVDLTTGPQTVIVDNTGGNTHD